MYDRKPHRWAGGSRGVGRLHHKGHPADHLEDAGLALQRLPCEEEQVEGIPKTDPPDDKKNSVAKQVLPELRNIRLQKPGGEQQSNEEQDRPTTQ